MKLPPNLFFTAAHRAEFEMKIDHRDRGRFIVVDSHHIRHFAG